MRNSALAVLLLFGSLGFAQEPNEEYCEELHAERTNFLNAKSLQDAKLKPVFSEGINAGKTSDTVLLEAKKLKLSINKHEIAAYKKDFYNANCSKAIEKQKIADNMPPEQKYCASLGPIAVEADRYRTNQMAIRNNWDELNKLQSAIFKDVEGNALVQRASFEAYAQMIAAKSKSMGKEIKLSEYARAQYVSSFYNKYCVTEAGALAGNGQTMDSRGRSKEYINAVAPDKLPIFKPFPQEATAKASK